MDGVSKASRLSGFPKSSYYHYRPAQQHADNRRKPRLDVAVLQAIENEVMQHPSYGIRRVTAMLRRRSGIIASRKKVYRLMKLANLVRKASVRKHTITVKRFLTVPGREAGPPLAAGHHLHLVWTGRLVLLSVQYTRLLYQRMAGVHFQHPVRHRRVHKTLEMAVLERFPDGAVPEGLATRSDGGSQYTSDRFISALKAYGIKQEVTGKNRPDQNAYIEAFHRSLKEDCIWQHDFQTFHEADAAIRQFFYEYNWDRPHSSLKYMTPKEFYAAYGGTG